ncbi:hypothetical protein P3W45_000024 [Vairimorpha bombi]|jgi:hypothetical protein
MDVTLRITDIDIPGKYDTIEFVYKNTSTIIQEAVSFTILTLHDFLFEKVLIQFKSKGFPWDKYTGIIILQNTFFDKSESRKNIIDVLSSRYTYRADFYDLKGLKIIGKCALDYTVKYLEDFDTTPVQEQDNFVQSVFNLFLNQQKSVLLANFKSVVDDFLIGSHSCKVNFILGLYFLEEYTSRMHYKMTKDLRYENIKYIKKLKLHEKSKEENEGYDLEKLFLGDMYKYEYGDLTDFTNYYYILGKGHNKNFIQHSDNVNKFEKKIKNNNRKFNIYKMFDNLFSNDDILSTREALDDIENSILNLNISEIIQIRDKDFYPNKINIDEIQKIPSDTRSVLDVLDNNDYVICHKKLIKEIIDNFYYSVGSYGNSWATTFCKRRRKVDQNISMDSNRRAILEFLDIDNNRLLSVQFADENIPEHIIFYEKEMNRLVVSFKGTSTSDEALKDLNCRYTKFYEGYAHKGIKHMAYAFVKNKTKELFEMAENCKTKNILFTGHSLGGSLAVMVHLIYERQEISKLFNIVTIAFSAAPTVSYNIANMPHKNLYVLNYGNDFVPRLSYGSFSEMKYTACSIGDNSRFLFSPENIEDDLRIIREHVKKNNLYPKLYTPGLVYHFKRINVVKKKRKISLLLYKKVSLAFYEHMVVIKHATMHHMLPHILKVFSQGMNDWDEIDNE